jgi:hypothetical protein
MSSAVQVQLPPVLRAVVGGEKSLEATGGTVEEVLKSLARARPALGLHFFDESGNVRRNIICLHEGVVIRAREFAGHNVAAGDELILTNALAGG